jgi:light-harvesting protein B-800-850 alpha chain
MIYGKLWLVVKPTVGIPVFLGAVALSSFLVHYMLLTHTTWLPKFLEGKAVASASIDSSTPVATAPPAAQVAAAPTK